MFEQRMDELRARMGETGFDVVLITDEDTVYYLSGYYDYLHMEFGRPTILVVPRDDRTILITPTIDLVSANALAKVDRVVAWNDGAGSEWRKELPAAFAGAAKIGIESDKLPPVVHNYIDMLVGIGKIDNITPLLSRMRMVKSPKELQLARHAGEVAGAMMAAGREVIAKDVPEFEVAIATSQAGTRKAAELLSIHYCDADMSPNTHFLQIMASGKDIVKTHHRASTRIMKHGEPVFLCFCGMTNFHRFKLGFDRTFWIGEIVEPRQEKLYEVAVASQQAALSVLKSGVTAEDVHAAYAEVIQEAGFDYPFRCGRGTGFSFLEKPQLVTGDKTILQPGMVLAVDGSIATDSFRAQVGDSFIVTEDGWDQITQHSKVVEDLIL
jgi:Xaa-Pro aminopeptidase